MPAAGSPSPFVERLVLLVESLRRAGIDVSTGEVIDATATLTVLPLDDRAAIHAGLRGTLVKSSTALDRFDRLFALHFSASSSTPADDDVRPAPALAPGAPPPASVFTAALRTGSPDDIALLAAQAVEMYAGIDSTEGTERYFLHRVLRAIDLSRMLTAAMQQARRDGQSSELELALLRSELGERLEEFRRQLAAEIARRMAAAGRIPDVELAHGVTDPTERSLVELSRLDLDELRRIVQPLARQLAARIGHRRRLRSTGRLDVRRTVRRSLASGGVPLEAIHRRKYPQRPEIVLLCDVSGSVAEFAQFTFTLVNAIHAELRRVRSFAFVDGVGEVTDLFATALYEIPIGRFTERKGVIGVDGHSDYGAAFGRFVDEHLADAVGPRSTVIITGDARSNYRPANVEAMRAIANRARRVYWLHPEPAAQWETTDGIIAEYRPHCDGVYSVQTLAQLADVIGNLL